MKNVTKERRLREGRCASCGGPKNDQRWNCEDCIEATRIGHKLRRLRRQQSGLCVRCETPLNVLEKYKKCPACRRLEREERQKWLAKRKASS